MKLYTEEQVRKAMEYYIYTSADFDELFDVESAIISRLTPIELPSDEEIEKAMIDQDIVRQQGYCHCFLEGGKWMKEQILNQNK